MEQLVSIVVITYNSSEFILETLESVKKQNYKHIELIISDDCSTDNTVDLCRKWLEENSIRFISTKLITSSINTGIPSNCNRGVRSSSGEWVKLIAGDDVFLPQAITSYIDFANLHPGCNIIHTPVIRMIDSDEKITYQEYKKKDLQLTQRMSLQNQRELLNITPMVKAPTVFIRRKSLEAANFFDEHIRNCEDWPMWLRLNQIGEKFYFLPEPLIYYRIHDDSVYSGQEGKHLVSSFYKTEHDIYIKYVKKHLSPVDRIFRNYFFKLQQFLFKKNNSGNKRFWYLTKSIGMLPFLIYRKLIFIKNSK